MKDEEVAQCRPYFRPTPGEWVNMGVQADNLAGEYFITTGSGKYFRNVELDPEHNMGIVEINDKGDSWRIVWGLEGGARPTSEFPSHFMNHSVRKAATNGANRVIYHCHATNVIAMTYILPLTDRVLFPAPCGRVRRNARSYSRKASASARGWFPAARRLPWRHRADEALSGGCLGAAWAVCLRAGL